MLPLRRQTIDIDIPAAFRPLLGPARYKGAYGGRGSAKSWFFAQQMVLAALEKPGFRGVCLREVQRDLKESAKLLIEDTVRRLGAPGFEHRHSETRTPGDGLIIYRGLQDLTADSIKSLENFKAAWIEEAHTVTARSWELLRPTIRAPGSEIWCSWNPRDATDTIDRFFRGPNVPPLTKVVSVSYKDNPWFPAELEVEREWDYENSPDRYAHIWLGAYEPTVVGAIFTQQNINEQRRSEAPSLRRIYVALDPNKEDGEVGDEAGIVVGGEGEDGRGYLLADYTIKGGPSDWARMVVSAYDGFDADAIVVEKNQGGVMCRLTLETVRKSLPIIEVVATRGKHVRAEPIAALYTAGRISHVGAYPELEGELTKITPRGYEGKGSPNRADAAVWLWTKLFPQMVRPRQRQYKRPAVQHSAWGA